MRTLNNDEMNRFDEIEKTEKLATYSVQLAEASYADDTYNGTLEECIDYLKDTNYDGDGAQIALITLTDDGCADTTLELYKWSVEDNGII